MNLKHQQRYDNVANSIGYLGEFFGLIILIYLFWGYGIRKPDQRDIREASEIKQKKSKDCNISDSNSTQ